MPEKSPLPRAPLTMHLVRHGRTEYNAAGRLQGWCDSPLTADGLVGVQATAEHLRTLDLAGAYASPSGRTTATASAILVHHRETALTCDPGLREFNFGDFEARPEAELFDQVDPAVLFRGIVEGTFPGLPGGEPVAVFLARVAASFDAIVRAHPDGGSVLVVSHGVTLLAYLAMVAGELHNPVANASVTTVQVDPDGTTWIRSLGVDPSGVAVPAGALLPVEDPRATVA
ncbi:histidine phosphatase family protein [Pengzhenrongella frigida]|uniref:Histidine phosphatase family protein n=1 Tax=Pengzhenrongella frigida TaxID=1259133 RepID=A0A4Q5N6Y3_9MICO|nr:histidine phosphatase family protein [Cellulomonas sp. HLT2-17]RYV52797.1 histidine phosphatase family protein [Cellulomonas sp. HLT2-17]